MAIRISDSFDGGAIEVLSAAEPAQIRLNLRADSHADIHQWFHFRVQGARGHECCMQLMNAGQATFAQGWDGYQACASDDGEHWFRVPTSFDGNVLTIRHTPRHDSVFFAYFEPYSWQRHLRLLGRAQRSPLARLENLGASVDGRDIDLLSIGAADAPKKIWIIARQHPGETMAEWFIEGMVDALLDGADPCARSILQRAVFHIVPNMNPDGSVRGNLRTNAAGANLNREWMAPSLERSPEVHAVRQKIHQTGCDFFLDVHGDEALPYVFIAGSEMLENFSERQAREQQLFIDALSAASPDFQTEHGYPSGKYREDLLKLASKYIGHAFQCPSLTLEMPFKDNANLPDAEHGWSGARSAHLGRAVLAAILQLLRATA